jgi:hypothetical protein
VLRSISWMIIVRFENENTLSTKSPCEVGRSLEPADS